MARMLATVELLRRRYQFRGYIHLKIIPGACRAAIEQAIRMASRVSVNIESPNADRLGRLTQRKDFYQDIIAIMRQIREGYQEIGRSCTQTTQFVVGAAGESDREIVRSTARLYERFAMNRVYFSAFQDPEVISPRENVLFSDMPTKRHTTDSNSFIREHRLYQVDFLLRKYRFGMDDIYFDEGDRLSLRQDPKRVWAERHPEFFPVDINRVEYDRLLRVPGIGPVGASRILNTRRRSRIRTLSELSKLGVRSRICGPFIRLAGRSADRMLPFHR